MFISKAAHINVKTSGVAYRKPKAAANCHNINISNYIMFVGKFYIAIDCRYSQIFYSNIFSFINCSLSNIAVIGMQVQIAIVLVNVQLAADDNIFRCVQVNIIFSIDVAFYVFIFSSFRVIFMSDVNRAFTVNIYAASILFHRAKNQRAVLFSFNVDCILNIGINNRAAVFNTQPFSSCANTAASRNKVNRVAGVDVADVVCFTYNIAVSGNINISARYAAQRKVNNFIRIFKNLLQFNVACRVSADVAVVGKRYLHCLQSVIYFMPNIAAAAFKVNTIADNFIYVQTFLSAQAQVVSSKFISVKYGILRQQVNVVSSYAIFALYCNHTGCFTIAVLIKLNTYRGSAFNGNCRIAPNNVARSCGSKFVKLLLFFFS